MLPHARQTSSVSVNTCRQALSSTHAHVPASSCSRRLLVRGLRVAPRQLCLEVCQQPLHLLHHKCYGQDYAHKDGGAGTVCHSTAQQRCCKAKVTRAACRPDTARQEPGRAWLENMPHVGPSKICGGEITGVTLSVCLAMHPPAGSAFTWCYA